MKFNIPFTLSDKNILKKKVHKSSKAFRKFKKSNLEEELKNSRSGVNAPEYIAISFRTFLISFFTLLVIFTFALFFLGVKEFYLYGPSLSLIFSLFVFARQMTYPKMYSSRKAKRIEKNLISVLQDMLVQLSSGVPIYKILINLSATDYGEASDEFKVAVNEINSGISQIDALENLIKKNKSEYFKRVLWQISNGLRSGSDMDIVLEDSIDNLNKEQGIQIQNYGNKLNPLIVFYMLVAVIIPSLSITFLIILSSMIGISSEIVILLFLGLGVFIILIQVMFLGLVKTRRPSLL